MLLPFSEPPAQRQARRLAHGEQSQVRAICHCSTLVSVQPVMLSQTREAANHPPATLLPRTHTWLACTAGPRWLQRRHPVLQPAAAAAQNAPPQGAWPSLVRRSRNRCVCAHVLPAAHACLSVSSSLLPCRNAPLLLLVSQHWSLNCTTPWHSQQTNPTSQ